MGNESSFQSESDEAVTILSPHAPKFKKPRTLKFEQNRTLKFDSIGSQTNVMSLHERPGSPMSAPPSPSLPTKPAPPLRAPPAPPSPSTEERNAGPPKLSFLVPITFSSPQDGSGRNCPSLCSPQDGYGRKCPSLCSPMQDMCCVTKPPVLPTKLPTGLQKLSQMHKVEVSHDHGNRRLSTLVQVYKVEKHVLGRGYYGVVRRGRHRDLGHEVAIKSIPKHKIKNMHAVRREIKILHGLDHPNIIKYYETFEDRRYIHIVMELCSGGELFDRISSGSSRMTERQVRCLVKKILEAISFCHRHQIVHRDLKPENFLLTSPDLEKAELKVIDFGLSIALNDPEIEMTARVGTAYYIAPEVLRRRYTKSCDLWSIGVVLYMLLVGYPPFCGASDAEVMSKVMKGKYNCTGDEWEHISSSVKNLITHLLDIDPLRRFSADQALAHGWFKDFLGQGDKVIPTEVHSQLRQYCHHHVFKRVVLNLIAKNVEIDGMRYLKKVFTVIDKGNKGHLTLNELDQALRSSGHGASAEDIKMLTSKMDMDQNGVIGYHEFLAASLSKKYYLQEERIFWAFSQLDHDDSGYITKQDLAQVIQEHHWDCIRILDLLDGIDLDNDGRIDYYEFLTAMHGATPISGNIGCKPERKDETRPSKRKSSSSLSAAAIATPDTSGRCPSLSRGSDISVLGHKMSQ